MRARTQRSSSATAGAPTSEPAPPVEDLPAGGGAPDRRGGRMGVLDHTGGRNLVSDGRDPEPADERLGPLERLRWDGPRQLERVRTGGRRGLPDGLLRHANR